MIWAIFFVIWGVDRYSGISLWEFLHYDRDSRSLRIYREAYRKCYWGNKKAPRPIGAMRLKLRSLYADWLFPRSVDIETVSESCQLFCSELLIEHHLCIDRWWCCETESCRNICLDDSRDHIDRRSLSCEYQVESWSSSHCRDFCEEWEDIVTSFHLFWCSILIVVSWWIIYLLLGLHEECHLFDDYHPSLVLSTIDVCHSLILHLLVSIIHLISHCLQNTYCIIYGWAIEMDIILFVSLHSSKFHTLRIDDRKVCILWLSLQEIFQKYGLSRSWATCHDEMWGVGVG